MLYAIATAFLYACSGVSGRKSALLVGSVKANMLRLALAALVVGLWSWPVAMDTEPARRLFWSGVLGFGVGDIALFLALPRLGARLTLLINLCTAPVFGTVGDKLLLGTQLQPKQMLCCAIILTGVGIAVLGNRGKTVITGRRWVGWLLALMAGFGQGTGASLSRWAHESERRLGIELAGHAETFLRILPGLAMAAGAWLVLRRLSPRPLWFKDDVLTPRAAGWVVVNATCGAILGVTCFQLALMQVSSGVALSITAMTPIIVMPMTAYIEKDVPTLASIGGGVVAVTGVVLLNSGF